MTLSQNSRNLQRSEWVMLPIRRSQNQQPFSTTDVENQSSQKKQNVIWKSIDCCPSMPGLVRGLLLGVAVGCLLLFIALLLWLTKTSKTVTTTTITSNTATTTINVTASAIINATATMTINVTASTTINTAATTITYVPYGIYALTIPTCATWNSNGITVAGKQNGASGQDLISLDSPVSIFVDNDDTLFVTDRDNHRIMKYYPNSTSGIIIAGNNTLGTNSYSLSGPKGVAADQSGAVIVADSDNYRIQKFTVGSLVGTTLFANITGSPLGQIRDLHIDVNNNIYITDSDYNQVVKYTPYSPIGIVLAGGNGSGSATDQLDSPYGNFMDVTNILYVADSGNDRVLKYLPGSKNGIVVAGATRLSGPGFNRLNFPRAIIVDNNENIYVVDSNNNRIMKWTTNYTLGGTCIIGCSGSAGTAVHQLKNPRDVKFDKYGNIYVSDLGNNRVQKFLIDTSCAISG